jgi:hypothetical protein
MTEKQKLQKKNTALWKMKNGNIIRETLVMAERPERHKRKTCPGQEDQNIIRE